MLYETTFIIDGYVQEERQTEIVSKIENLIAGKGGKIAKTERMGKRRLAYEIGKKQHGYYIYVLFEADDMSIITELEREFRFNEGILRYLTVKVHRDSQQFKKYYSPQDDETGKPEAAVAAESVPPSKENLEGVTDMSDLLMPNVNSVIIAGRLTKDPAFRRTTNGTPVANFTISCNRRYKDNVGQTREEVCYVGVVAWYKLAESCSENLRKNGAVIVEGELQSRSWKLENGYYKNIVEIKAHRIQFLQKEGIDSDSAATHDLHEMIDGEREDAEDRMGQDISEQAEVDSHGDGMPADPVSGTEKASPAAAPPKEEEEKPKYDFGYRNLQI